MLTIEKLKNEITSIAPQYGVKKAVLFGSYANNTATENSDVDLLLEFETLSVSIYKIAGIKLNLEKNLQKTVDIIHAPIPQNSLIKIDKEVPLYEREG